MLNILTHSVDLINKCFFSCVKKGFEISGAYLLINIKVVTTSLYAKINILAWSWIFQGGIKLAKPISPTPILKGKDAERFLKRMEKPPTKEKKEFLKKAVKAYEDHPF